MWRIRVILVTLDPAALPGVSLIVAIASLERMAIVKGDRGGCDADSQQGENLNSGKPHCVDPARCCLPVRNMRKGWRQVKVI